MTCYHGKQDPFIPNYDSASPSSTPRRKHQSDQGIVAILRQSFQAQWCDGILISIWPPTKYMSFIDVFNIPGSTFFKSFEILQNVQMLMKIPQF